MHHLHTLYPFLISNFTVQRADPSLLQIALVGPAEQRDDYCVDDARELHEIARHTLAALKCLVARDHMRTYDIQGLRAQGVSGGK